MTPKHRVCTFIFRNGTEIRAAVTALVIQGREVREKTFEEFIAAAKEVSWNGDETHGRGELIRFDVGSPIFIPGGAS